MVTDEDILKEFINSRNVINSNKTRTSWLDKHIKFKIFLTSRFPDIPDNIFSYKEVIWRIKNKIEIRPVCKICGGSVEFIGKSNKKWNKGYKHFCDSCKNTDAYMDIIKANRENTNLKRYGSKSPLSNREVRTKIDKANIEKYGVKNQFSRIDLQNKIKTERFIKTGYNYPLQNPEIRQKQHETCVKKFGEESFAKTETFRKLYEDENFLSSCLEKKEATLTKNKTHNKSEKENLLFKLLSEIYPNIVRQYKSDYYPFSCDFYISDLDLYIEFHGSHYHNGRLFNKELDNDALNELQKKAYSSNTSKINQYHNIIETWTIRDVKKYETALRNKINYLILYPQWNSNWNKLCYQYVKNRIDATLYELIQSDLKNILATFINQSNVQLIYGERRK